MAAVGSHAAVFADASFDGALGIRRALSVRITLGIARGGVTHGGTRIDARGSVATQARVHYRRRRRHAAA